MRIAPNKFWPLLLVLMLANVQAFAAPTNPPPPTPPPPPGTPIDGGLIILMMFALTFALYKLRDIKKARI